MRYIILKHKFRLRFIFRTFYIIHKFLSKIYFSLNPSFTKKIDKNFLINIKPIPKKVLKTFYKEKFNKIIFKKYLNHEFDLLGSGWCNCNKIFKPKKIDKYKFNFLLKKNKLNIRSYYINNLNYANKSKCFQVAKYIPKSYKNIDWNLDIKSGFRWSEKQWYRDIKYGIKLGSDIKFPWELARLQHLPQLAIYLNNLDRRSTNAKNIEAEIYNQILDFIAFNPPLYGVNWSCTMEVGIRAVNILLAIYLIQNKKSSIWEKQINIIINSLYDHAEYILNNLEWSKNRGNHYLTNICGLLCLSSLLPETYQTNQWLCFSIAEINREVLYQFNSDGSNFEGSTAYHYLTLEMILFSIIISLKNKESRLIKISKLTPEKYNFLPNYAGTPLSNTLQKNVNFKNKKIYSLYSNTTLQLLSKACSFMEDCSDYEGIHPQIGDNDSGRFLNLKPNWVKIKSKYAKIKFKCPNNFQNENYYLFQKPLLINNVIELARSVGIGSSKINIKNSFHYEFGKYIAEDKVFDIVKPKNFYFIKASGEERNLNLLKKEINKNDKSTILKKEIKLPQNISNFKLNYRYYPDFGVHLWKNSFMFISIRSIQKKKPIIKSHFHDDQLSITFKLQDKYIFKDFGSYIYTPFPKMRNLYRSRKIHFPTSYEPNTEKKTFENLDISSVYCTYSGIKGFSGIYLSKYSIDKFVMNFSNNKVYILMNSESRFNKENLFSKNDNSNELYYSPGYGILEY